MKLADSFHVGADFFVDRVLHRYGIVIAGMNMIQIILPDWKHILEEKCGLPSIEFAENNGKASAVFLHLFIMDSPEFFYTGT